jgi:hypothetical protein
MSMVLPYFIMIIGGLVYLIKPNFRKPKMGTKNFFTRKELSSEEYIKYVRIIALMIIALSVLMILKKTKAF